MHVLQHVMYACWLRVFFASSLLLLPLQLTTAKTIENEFQLSQLNTEAVLGSFCVSPRKRGHLKFQLLYQNDGEPVKIKDEDLKFQLRLYRDDNWTSYETASGCIEKAAFAIYNHTVNFTIAGGGAIAQTQQHATNDGSGKTPIHMQIPNANQQRAHYYYVVVAACSLLDEFFMDHSQQLPVMEYTLELTNNGSHLSADELHLVGPVLPAKPYYVPSNKWMTVNEMYTTLLIPLFFVTPEYHAHGDPLCQWHFGNTARVEGAH